MIIISVIRQFLIKCIVAYYTIIDPVLQKLWLINYINDIHAVEDGESRTSSGIYCIFVYYETDGKVSHSVRNIMTALQRKGINIISVTNAKLSDLQKDFLISTSHTLILRGNQGFDFGAYKDCIMHLQNTAPDLTRIILINDSVYYFSNGIDQFIERIIGQEDSIAAFENWDPIHAYHLQSFALNLSAKVFQHPSFVKFWKDYSPVNNRLHAIQRGEKKLSEACLKASTSTKIAYATKDALNAAENGAGDLEPFEFFISSPIDIRQDKAFVFSGKALEGKHKATTKELNSLKLLRNIDGIYRGSPIHSGMMFFVWYTNCPMVKKDVVFREQFRFWEIEYILRKRFDDVEVDEFLTMVRKKGTLKNIKPLKRIKVMIGAA